MLTFRYAQPTTFVGSGNTLQAGSKPSNAKGKAREEPQPASTASWGNGGQTLSGSSGKTIGAGGASVPVPRSQAPASNKSTPIVVDSDSDDDYYDDGLEEGEDPIDIDSD